MSRLLGAQILEQNLLPNFQRRVILSRYEPRDVKEVVRIITDLQPRVLGVALHVSKDATINSVALATSKHIFYISLDNACRRSEFKTLLALDNCPLVSFGMARIVLILYLFFGCQTRGVDLGTFVIVQQAIKVDTENLRHWELSCLQQLALNLELLEANLLTARTTILMDTIDGETLYGKADAAEGKNTTVTVLSGEAHKDIENIRIVGREKLTNAERARDEFILRLLRGEIPLEGPDFTDMIWFPAFVSAQTNHQDAAPTFMALAHLGLNSSQTEVAHAMISINSQPLVVAHGPPGTGKTRTISAASWYWDKNHCPVWVVAQSNVGVKNIAETFVKSGIDFKILVSKEFYVEWTIRHEHIYGPIEKYLIRSDDLFREPNPDKQVPPYGQDIAPGLQTIFDFSHLCARSFFLDVQYRMPVPLGNFVSKEVYNSKLQSEHDTGDFSCVAFVDVSRGEEIQMGQSWITQLCQYQNQEEVHTVVNLVRDYYRNTEFSIITPYDAQRGAIQKALKADKHNLPWDCVYNVDSFQGHENKFIILSLVRTDRPGFLRSQNRMNVMLTRCKRGMVVVANRRFLETKAAQATLLGKLVQYWQEHRDSWMRTSEVSDCTADLPGAPAPEYRLPYPSMPMPASLTAHLSMQQLEFAMRELAVRDRHPASLQSAPVAESFLSWPSTRLVQKTNMSMGDRSLERTTATLAQTSDSMSVIEMLWGRTSVPPAQIPDSISVVDHRTSAEAKLAETSFSTARAAHRESHFQQLSRVGVPQFTHGTLARHAVPGSSMLMPKSY
ncbi:hypothetical protein WOLCODRAFT_145835 [Wolfiporia cocos MD-104 SS10]|uniref:DNA2/NAM7 helicase-like C-terminal domain-containing protein n=1 Tax=Wolfiporia cocos (strain MD-104) TaxID=742152 RepID=A0A2H3J1D7_WOLCO|nr:hypothetical protein WOLCODRAFT_145835 [Wolfiporia cocos MD-104 SS10]